MQNGRPMARQFPASARTSLSGFRSVLLEFGEVKRGISLADFLPYAFRKE